MFVIQALTRRDGTPILEEFPETGVTAEAGQAEVGVFLRFTAEKPGSRLVLPVGKLAGVERFTICHRYEPFWMTAKAGKQGRDVPPETQYLLAKRADDYLLIVPLVDGAFRCSLEGRDDDTLLLVAESGDDAVVTDTVLGLFVAVGPDPFTLLATGAWEIANRLGIGRLRTEKPVPDFMDSFGWCTWDAFYQEVSHEKVREGLGSFRAGGVPPKYLILDDGWQSVRPFPTGEKRLTSFAANEKFPGDLKPTVTMAKQEFGVETFLVWHAVVGYWGGVDADALPGYGVRPQARKYSSTINEYAPELINWFGRACGTVPAEAIYRFYQDYHRHLREQGVDGVKVDNQASLEGVAYGLGGRVALMRAYREALEGSAHVHFGGNLINCMSCANEMLFSTLNSTLTRTSTDFWPNRPESHGLHLYVNAQVSAFWGEFVHPDWDMFQSGHAMGAYHAAGRAVGGCPVYVSDKPGAHDFGVLHKLVLPDGSVLRGLRPGLPTLDCLFRDPTKEDVLLKIWNENPAGYVIGAFHARYGEGVGDIRGAIRPADAHHCPTPDDSDPYFVASSHYGCEIRLLRRDDEWPLTLAPLTAEVFTVVPRLGAEVVPIGLSELFNGNGAVLGFGEGDEGGTTLIHLEPFTGRFTAWCARRPARITVEGEGAETELTDFSFDGTSGRLDVRLPGDTFLESALLRITLPVEPGP